MAALTFKWKLKKSDHAFQKKNLVGSKKLVYFEKLYDQIVTASF